MSLRLMQAALVLGLTACGGSPSATAQETSGGTQGGRPFTVTPVADFSKFDAGMTAVQVVSSWVMGRAA